MQTIINMGGGIYEMNRIDISRRRCRCNISNRGKENKMSTWESEIKQPLEIIMKDRYIDKLKGYQDIFKDIDINVESELKYIEDFDAKLTEILNATFSNPNVILKPGVSSHTSEWLASEWLGFVRKPKHKLNIDDYITESEALRRTLTESFRKIDVMFLDFWVQPACDYYNANRCRNGIASAVLHHNVEGISFYTTLSVAGTLPRKYKECKTKIRDMGHIAGDLRTLGKEIELELDKISVLEQPIFMTEKRSRLLKDLYELEKTLDNMKLIV